MKTISYLSIGLALLLVGCGGSSTPRTTNTQKVSIPTQIDIAFPEALKGDKKTQNKVFSKSLEYNGDTTTNLSRGYSELKNSIASIENTKKELEINLLLAAKIMPQIQNKCQDIPLGTTCSIAAGELSLTLDVELYKEIFAILGNEIPADFDESQIPTETMKLGKTTFTQYAKSKDFQYSLVLDMTNLQSDVGEEVLREIQTIKWTEDENKVWSIYDYKASSYSALMSLRYVKKESGQTEMEIKESYSDNEEANGSFYLKLTNLNDDYTLNSNAKNTFGTEVMRTSSMGIIGKNGGYLQFRGVFTGLEYREKDTFDAKGESLESIYCDEGQGCDLEDESTWLKSDNYVEPEFPEDPNEPSFDMVELVVSGGALKEGIQYLLLAPNTRIENKTAEDIFSLTIGDMLSDKEYGTYAMLYSSEYLNKLDELVMVEVQYPYVDVGNEVVDADAPVAIEAYDAEPTFKLLDAASRPTLTQK